MDLDMDMDLRWGDIHAPTKAFSEYNNINKVVRDLNTAPLRQYQRTKILKSGVFIERGIRKKYGNNFKIIERLKRFFNPYIDKAFGCIQQDITPPSGEVVNDVTSSYVLNTNIKDFDYYDDTVKEYFDDEPDSAYAVCYSFKRNPVEDLKTSYEILSQNYIKNTFNSLSIRDIGSGVTYLTLTSEGEDSSSKSLEEAHELSLFSSKKIPSDSFWLVGPVAYKIMLKNLIWNRDISKNELYQVLKIIRSLDYKLDYWDKKYLKGYDKAEDVLEYIGKFCYENYSNPNNVEFMIDMTKLFPEKSHKIAHDIYQELSGKNLDYLSFEKQAETIVTQHVS